MPDIRTTITFQERLYKTVAATYKQLGFTKVGDLVNEAVRDYLHRRALEEKHASMARAAANPAYRRLLREVTDEFRVADAEGLADY